VASPGFPDFRPRAPWFGPDLQTLRNLFRGPTLSLDVDGGERLELPLPGGDRLSARLLHPEAGRDGAPLVVLVHGLGGSEDSDYLAVSSSHLLAGGWPVLQLNLRGSGPSRASCREQYHAGRSEDFHAALGALPETLIRDGIVAVGFSLGGNMLLKHAAEYGGLRGVVTVSAPIDLEAASRRFLDPRNRVYHAYLLRGMKREALGEGAEVSTEERRVIPRIRTIWEFDEKIVAPRNGFTGALDYYAKSHARQFLGAIEVPALLIHARNDPWIPASAYLSYAWRANPRLTPLLPAGGGHVGFHGADSRVPWHDRCIERFLTTV
jgi:predicted alpha/beta-fold hydrolase